MGFFAMMFLFFVFMRMMHGRRRHFVRLHYYGAHRNFQHHMRGWCFAAMAADAPRPNAYEQLKQRYVRGDIDVEEYERGVDEILRSPQGQRLVN